MANVITELKNQYTALRNQAIVEANERIAKRQQSDKEFDRLYQDYMSYKLQLAHARYDKKDDKGPQAHSV